MLRRFLPAVLPVLLIAAPGPSTTSAAETKALNANRAAKSLTVAPPIRTAPTVGGVPLTSGECTGLGGKIEEANRVCNAAGQKACKTVDRDGVVRVACIDEVKN